MTTGLLYCTGRPGSTTIERGVQFRKQVLYRVSLPTPIVSAFCYTFQGVLRNCPRVLTDLLFSLPRSDDMCSSSSSPAVPPIVHGGRGARANWSRLDGLGLPFASGPGTTGCGASFVTVLGTTAVGALFMSVPSARCMLCFLGSVGHRVAMKTAGDVVSGAIACAEHPGKATDPEKHMIPIVEITCVGDRAQRPTEYDW